jgi:hypothetical protein
MLRMSMNYEHLPKIYTKAGGHVKHKAVVAKCYTFHSVMTKNGYVKHHGTYLYKQSISLKSF